MKKKNKEIGLLLHLIEEGYNGHAWHGPTLRGSIRGLKFDQAAWRPRPGRHNIWEIVIHAAYWKYIVRRRLLGEKRGSFALKGSNWIRRPAEKSEHAWKHDIDLLDEMHKSMFEAISQMDPGDLQKKPAGSKFNNLKTIAGIACHDIYHAGQIQLIKRLMKR